MRTAKRPKPKRIIQRGMATLLNTTDMPIIIPKAVSTLLLNQERKERSDLVALYHFYMMTAQWQGTPTVFATNSYVCEGLGWTKKRLQKRKATLKKLGLIHRIAIKDEEGKWTGNYVHLRFAWTERDLKRLAAGKLTRKPEGAITGHPVFIPSNAKPKNNNIKLHSLDRQSRGPESKTGSRRLREKNKKYLPLAKQLATIILQSKNIKTTPDRMLRWASEIRKLHDDGVTSTRIKKALKWYSKHMMDEFVPVIESGSSLRSKFIKLENAMRRSKGQGGTRTTQDELPLLGVAS